MSEKENKKKSGLIIAIILALLAIAVAAFFIISGSKIPVNFDSDGGSAVATVKVKKGTPVGRPEDPVYDGYRLDKWTLNGHDYDFSQPVYQEITLKANYIKTWKVNFVENGAATKTVVVDAGKPVEAIDANGMEKKVFIYWMLNDKEYDFSQPVNEDITLNALYKTLFDVTFYNGDKVIAKTEITDGETIHYLPDNPEKEDNKFIGWTYKDGKPFDSATPITENTELYAQFRVYVPIKSMSFENKTMTVVRGDTATLKLKISPSNWAEDLTWTSSKPEVGTVDKNGLFTALGFGSTQITVKSESGKTATCVVNVSVPITGVEQIWTSVTLNMHQARQITFNPIPSDAIYSVKYTSNDTSVAKVDSKGVIYPVKGGKTSITVEFDTGLKREITVYVDEYKLTATVDGYTPEDNHTFYLWTSTSVSVPTLTPKLILTYTEKGVQKSKEVTGTLVTGAKNPNGDVMITYNKSSNILYANSSASLANGYQYISQYVFSFKYTDPDGYDLTTSTFKVIIEPQLSFSIPTSGVTYSGTNINLPTYDGYHTFELYTNQPATLYSYGGITLIGQKTVSDPKIRLFTNWSYHREGSTPAASIEFRTTGGQKLKLTVK